MASNCSSKVKALWACCTVHSMLDEDQYVQSSQQRGIHVQEVDREGPAGLGVQELPPGRA
jgi:hypothetical protein